MTIWPIVVIPMGWLVIIYVVAGWYQRSKADEIDRLPTFNELLIVALSLLAILVGFVGMVTTFLS